MSDFLIKEATKRASGGIPLDSIYPFSSEWDEVPLEKTVMESGITEALIHYLIGKEGVRAEW